MDFKYRDAVVIHYFIIDLHEIVPAWQDFAKSLHADLRARVAKRFFVSLTEAGGGPVKAQLGVAFESIATQEVFGPGTGVRISETCNVEA